MGRRREEGYAAPQRVLAVTPERQLLSDLLEHTRRLPAHFYGEWEQELGRLEGRIESLLAKPVVIATMTDEAHRDHYTMRCAAGCRVRGIEPDYGVELEWATRWASEHAVESGHAVDVIDVRDVAEHASQGDPQ